MKADWARSPEWAGLTLFERAGDREPAEGLCGGRGDLERELDLELLAESEGDLDCRPNE